MTTFNWWDARHEFDVLVGKTFDQVVCERGNRGDIIRVKFLGPKSYMLYHHQNCCEYVHLAEIHGDLDDLVGSPILFAEESTSATWTFYRIGTVKGSVTLRWLGESNGYYSVSVDLAEIEP